MCRLLQHCIAESQNETDPSDICIRRVHALQDFVNEFGTALPNLARIVADHNEEFLAVLDGDTTLQQWTAEFVSGHSLQGCHKEVCDYRATIQRPDSVLILFHFRTISFQKLKIKQNSSRFRNISQLINVSSGEFGVEPKGAGIGDFDGTRFGSAARFIAVARA